jgi:hypothetical protein
MTFDEYAALPEGSYQGLSDLKQKVIGKNDTYYFLLWMGSEDEDMEDKFLELTAGVSSDTVKEYLINSGFSFFPDQEEKTLIRSLEQADNNLVYRDEEH